MRASTLPKKHSSIGINYQSLEMKGSRGVGAVENSDGASIFAGEFSTPVVFKEQSLDQYLLGGVKSDKSHLDTLSRTILKGQGEVQPRQSVMAPTAASLNNAMRVFRNQQRVLQENAKALLEKTMAETPGDVMQRRTKEMT